MAHFVTRQVALHYDDVVLFSYKAGTERMIEVKNWNWNIITRILGTLTLCAVIVIMAYSGK